MTCPICESGERKREFDAREMMFGWRDAFRYAECAGCGSYFLTTPPADLAKYYPDNYYSLAAPRDPQRRGGKLRRRIARYAIEGRSGFAERLSRSKQKKYPFITWIRLCRAHIDSAILDVGCGSGGLLFRMRRWGFDRLSGVDPYVRQELQMEGLEIRRQEITAVSGAYDVVMFNHVLEHVPDPCGSLRAARALLREGGRILVRVPVAGTYAAREYGADWFNLDAPRHLALPSWQGMQRLAARAGLAIVHQECDSDEKSLAMSEQYRRGMPMQGPRAEVEAAQMARWQKFSADLNARGDGDLGVFVLRAA